MKKGLIFTVMLLNVFIFSFAQNEADFRVGLTQDLNGVVILEYIGNATSVNIPSTIQGMPTKEISRDAFGSSSTDIMGTTWRGKPITSVVIPEGITTIPNDCFNSCENLRSVILPSTIVRIGDNAFRGCKSLREISLPEGLTNIGSVAFGGCTALTSINIPDSVTNIGGAAFVGSGLISINWPAKITAIQSFQDSNFWQTTYGMF